MSDEIKKQDFTEPDTIAESFLGKYIYDPEPNSETLPPRDSLCYTLTSWRDEFYLWRAGCWYRISDNEMRRLITLYLQNSNAESLQLQTNSKPALISIGTQKINNVMLCLRGRCGISELRPINSWPDEREKLVNTVAVKNGLLCWDKKDPQVKITLMKHTPTFFNLSILPYEFNPDAECPDFLNFLDDVMLKRQEYIDLLQLFVGYIFRPDLLEQKFLLCCGESANGKSVFFEVVQALVGKENCSQVGLTHFSDRFALYETLGKMVNLTAESSHIIDDEAENVLKGYVAGDRFTFERKFKDPISAEPTAKIMISTNSLPRFRDKTAAVWRRIILVPFDKVVLPESQIKDLALMLKAELSGILNWAFDGLRKLNNTGFVLPVSHNETIENYRRDADPARAFLLENYQPTDNGDYVVCKDLYNEYARWCGESGFEPINDRLFGKQVVRAFPNVEHNQTRQAGTTGTTNRAYVYSKIRRIAVES
jgi:P4 family phage/plasmid primase-like protien